MKGHIYSPLGPVSAKVVEKEIERNDVETLKRVVVAVALYDESLDHAESVCRKLTAHPNEEVRGNAGLGFGHLARRFEDLSRDCESLIKAGLTDESSYVRGQAWA